MWRCGIEPHRRTVKAPVPAVGRIDLRHQLRRLKLVVCGTSNRSHPGAMIGWATHRPAQNPAILIPLAQCQLDQILPRPPPLVRFALAGPFKIVIDHRMDPAYAWR